MKEFGDLRDTEWVDCLGHVVRQLPSLQVATEVVIKGAHCSRPSLISPAIFVSGILLLSRAKEVTWLHDKLLLHAMVGEYAEMLRLLYDSGLGEPVNLWVLASDNISFGRSTSMSEYELELQITRQLLSLGADVNVRDPEWNQTPLMSAATGHNYQLASTLLVEGAHIEARDRYGRTALSYAAEYAHSGMISLLLRHGADVSSVCSEGHTPIDYARKFNPNVTKLLQDMIS